MFRSLKFRHRIWILVVLAGIALVTVTLVTLVLGRASQRQVAGVETRYVPLLELARNLETHYAAIPRAFEDAAAAAEEGGLETARLATEQLEGRIRASARTIAGNGGQPEALVAELRAYHAIAHEVTAALVEGTPAEQLADQIETMRRTQVAFAERLDRATTPDRRELTAAFAEARRSQSTALRIDIVVAIGGLALMGLLSWTLIRRMVRALQDVSDGMTRLAEGEFNQPVEVKSRDELGDLAREANRTAERLREARERTQALLEETQRQAEELARANRYKSEFLANMSHELRTPLNSIMLLSKILGENEGGGLTAKQIEFSTLIHRSGEELLMLINDVLDLAKIEAGKQTLVCEPVKVEELADYARRMFAPVAAQRRLQFEVELVGAPPREIRTDRVRVHQILKNLLSNAFKFTERGKVLVTFAAGEGDTVELAVRDTGIGIATDQQAQIFEAFAQAEGGTSRKFGGTGLGLSIAKQLAERLGGSLRVESQLDVGSRFVLQLPVAGPFDDGVVEADSIRPIAMPRATTTERGPSPVRAGRPVLPTEEMVPERDSMLEGRSVLLVDDDMRSIYSLSNVLRLKHMHVLTAADRREALDELAAHGEISVVLIDITSARPEGMELVAELRRQGTMPIFALVAAGDPEARNAALAVGADACVAKPVDPSALLQTLRQRLADR